MSVVGRNDGSTRTEERAETARRRFRLERKRERRVCGKCGGDLEFLHVNARMEPVTRCVDCMELFCGARGTRKVVE